MGGFAVEKHAEGGDGVDAFAGSEEFHREREFKGAGDSVRLNLGEGADCAQFGFKMGDHAIHPLGIVRLATMAILHGVEQDSGRDGSWLDMRKEQRDGARGSGTIRRFSVGGKHQISGAHFYF